MFSGFAHHMQFRGQPFVNMILRIPGPSCTLNFCMFVTVAEISMYDLLIVVDIKYVTLRLSMRTCIMENPHTILTYI